ncbi:MAG: hypothetical protein HBSAPP04_07440 [Ignavibacteriaceae bacterium]|nr:MAG: hypothetical protein HBSAPP04_07440 [Ignavibacteriaceae bacterium]
MLFRSFFREPRFGIHLRGGFGNCVFVAFKSVEQCDRVFGNGGRVGVELIIKVFQLLPYRFAIGIVGYVEERFLDAVLVAGEMERGFV